MVTAADRERIAWLLAAGFITALTLAAVGQIVEHGVDVLFSDQWLIYEPLFRGDGPVEAFFHDNRPHRLGLGALVLWAGTWSTGWDARADSFAVVSILAISALLALVLKRKLFGRIEFVDLAIPAIVLNAVQIEAYLLVPYPAHGALPLLLMLLVCLLRSEPGGGRRVVLDTLLSLLLLFTGFGMLAAPLLFVVFSIEAAAALRPGATPRSRLLLVPPCILAAAMAGFVAAYRPGGEPSASALQVLVFSSLMPARFGSIELGRFGSIAIVAGLIILVAFAVASARSFRDLVRLQLDSRKSVIFILTAYSLLFAIFAGLGRSLQGVQYGQSSRYMTLMIPGMIGLYFAALGLERRIPRIAATSLVILISLGAILPPSLQHDQSSIIFSLARREWRDCYLATHDAQRCAERARMQVWVGPYNEKVQAQIDYLERNRLSLFRPQD